MTELPPDTALEPIPGDLILRLTRGEVPALLGCEVTRMHFPRSRPVQIHFQDGKGSLIAEWVGTAAADRAATETARLEMLGQKATLTPEADTGLLTREPGTDAKLPGLRLLHDPDFADATLARLGLTGPFRIDLVAHRLGKRAVLRIGHASGTAYARLSLPGAAKARVVADRHVTLWQTLRDAPCLSLPDPLGGDAGLGLSLYRALPGSAPRFHGLRGFVEAEAIARAIRALQDCPLDLPAHTTTDEIDLLRGWQSRLARVDAAAADRIATRIDRLESDLNALPPLALVTCHRDLHEGQIVIRAGRAGIMDFDTLCCGDPALDLGNLQAHLVLAGLRQGRSLAAFITAIERLFPDLPLRRITLWRQAALIRLALLLSFTSEAATLPPALLVAAE